MGSRSARIAVSGQAGLLEELAETRRQLSVVLRANAIELHNMRTRCADLQHTMNTLNQEGSLYSAKRAGWRRLSVLSPRELQVLKAIAEGHASKEIAYRLNITFKTVVCHRSRLMQKLGVHEVAGLTRLALAAGLIPLRETEPRSIA